MDADTDRPIVPLTDGATLNLATLPTPNLNVRANFASMADGRVGFALDAAYNRVEDTRPYSLAGDTDDGNFKPWIPTPGSHTLTATPYSTTGEAGPPLTINFVVTEV